MDATTELVETVIDGVRVNLQTMQRVVVLKAAWSP